MKALGLFFWICYVFRSTQFYWNEYDIRAKYRRKATFAIMFLDADSLISFLDGAIAQLGEHLTGSQGVRGSNPLSSIFDYIFFPIKHFYSKYSFRLFRR